MSNFNIIKLDAITSTNDWLKKKYHENECLDGDLIWANEQTMGRGQKNNSWLSEPGKNLTFSFFKIFPASSCLISPHDLNFLLFNLTIIKVINDRIIITYTVTSC